MKKKVKAWAYIVDGKIQNCAVSDDALCIHVRKPMSFNQYIFTKITITYELPKRKKK